MKRSLSALALALTLTSTAQAVPVKWSLDGTEFIGGNGTVSGTFTYDADTNMTSDVNITASAGNLILCTAAAPAPCAPDLNAAAYPGGTFTSTTGGNTVLSGPLAGSWVLLAFGDGLANTLSLSFSAPLTNAGGSVAMTGVFQWQCNGPAPCSRNTVNTPFRSAVNGPTSSAGTATAVPAPATLLLMGLSLLLMGRRRA